MTSLASDRSRSSRRSDQPQMDTSDDAQVSAQIRNIANSIVSPVPQRRIHVMDDQQHRQQHNSHHSLSPRSSSLGVPQQQRTHQHQQQQQQQQRQQHHQQMLHEDLSELTSEEMQERALSSGMTPNESMSDLYPAHSYQQHQHDLQQPPLPPQKSFSTVDNQHSYDASPQHHPTTTSTQENAANTQSPPKPKLRNLDTSMTAARGKVSSFFGGISDSIAHVGGSHSSSSQNSASASTPTISSAYPSAQAIPPRQASPRDYGRYGNTVEHHQPQPSSSYPTTSHMQAPPPSSAPQTRSISQPLQHQQSIPQYAIPPSQHGQQASTSSTATGSSFNLLPRSSFYGLDNHLQPEGDPAQPQQQQQRWRGERRASPSSAISRPASQSIPRSETGHYTSPSLGGASSQGGHSGSGEPTSTTRRRVTSWTTRSNASSVYGLNMASPQLGPSSSGDLPPVPPVAPHLTQAHLRPGQGVSLLSHQKTLDMYRANVKKTNDPEVTFELAQFMLGLAREMAYQEMTLSASSAMSPSTGGQGIMVPAPGGGMMMVMPNGNNHALSGVSEENLLSSLHDPDSSSPSPDPSFSFHSRSSGSSGDLASAALNASNRTFSNQGQTATGLQRRRGSLSPAPSISNTTARLGALGMNRTGSPTAASAGGHGTSSGQANANDRKALVAEALSLLKRNADRGHVDSQYFLADIYANGGLEGGASSSRSASANGGGGGSARQSLYAHAKDLLPSLSSQGNSASAGGGAGSGSVSPLESMRMNPSPTGSAASLTHAQGYNPAYAGQSTTYHHNHQKPDFDKALPLFIAAAKHGHAPSAYRAGECLENGWGCRKDSNKAVQFYRKSAAASFPEAMYRLGMAELNGELGLKDRQKEGFKWLKQVAALAENSGNNDQNQNDPSSSGVGGGGLLGMNGFSSSSSSGGLAGYDEDGSNSNSANQNNHATRLCTVQALHELALLHERGIHNVVFVDNEYAAELLARASELGYAPSAYKLGECYEYGRMGCPQDAALSIHYYSE